MTKQIENTTTKNSKEETKMTTAQKTLFETTTEELQKIISTSKTSKIVSQELSTGISYFEGKQRLCKILKTKRNAKIEINISLPKEMETKFNLTKISTAEAYKKHLGTMKYMATIVDEKSTKELLKVMVQEFETLKAKVAKEEIK